MSLIFKKYPEISAVNFTEFNTIKEESKTEKDQVLNSELNKNESNEIHRGDKGKTFLNQIGSVILETLPGILKTVVTIITTKVLDFYLKPAKKRKWRSA